MVVKAPHPEAVLKTKPGWFSPVLREHWRAYKDVELD